MQKLLDIPVYPFDREKNYEEWVNSRYDYVGSSAIASIVGVGTTGANSLYKEYVSRKHNFRGNVYTQAGHLLEEGIQKMAEVQYNCKIVPYNVSHISPEHKFCSATPDGLVYLDDELVGLNEVKMSSAAKDVDIWNAGDTPKKVIIQAVWQLGVCQQPWGLITALVQGNPVLKMVPVDFNQKLFDLLVTKADQFLKAVKKGRGYELTKAEGAEVKKLSAIVAREDVLTCKNYKAIMKLLDKRNAIEKTMMKELSELMVTEDGYRFSKLVTDKFELMINRFSEDDITINVRYT